MHVAQKKIWVQLISTIAIALTVVWAVGIVWQGRVNREAAIEQATAFSSSMHDATMAGLTGMMVTGTVAQRAVLLDQVRQLDNIRDLRVLRGEAVNKIFGNGTGADASDPDAAERAVLATGKTEIHVASDDKGEYLRVVRPAIASKNYLGKDCTTCHQVPEGTVLGAVSMKVSLDQTNALMARQRWQTILMAIVTCIPVLIVIYPFIRRVVTRPLEQGVDLAHGIASGDLTRDVVVDSRNEIGHLQRALHEMRGSLASIVGRVRRGTDTIAQASARIAGGNKELESRTEHQAQALHETAVSMSRLTDATRQNAEHASQANALAISASDVAKAGGAVVDQVVTTMDSINAASKRIAEINRVINDIAFQTNLLALNAAVEASRAGEHGRGFAVVASEVRALAQRSSQAAQEIKTLVDSTVEQVVGGSRMAHRAGQTMTEVVDSVKRVTDIMSEIDAASREQMAGIEEVNRTLSSLEGVTGDNARLVQEAAHATAALAEQATALDEAVKLFRLPARTDA
ncbi:MULTISPECIES: methyl-accepting chemotaxis protein [Rubrivivax]|uniref:HAMP domain-containing protein n=1 Tax=Rubrivivax benzoatilyticus TaxID=316997 RepID=A0ABX0HS46_9BURK|nr:MULTISPECIES: methyl-accepting chemotaxis protein [Rubrivivax]EGJ08713.1 methyl-accepting chemotaxis sensory transducer [Rubrivivax benzoatilyticus JA2 = ATCC BAA-35]NHK97867.1 HAMP domain-containing protein [Rubrivivax benzoatilyticus]NHL23369.1 HAMP domain-containing protein [Rubrivivax benzoatilyticus]